MKKLMIPILALAITTLLSVLSSCVNESAVSDQPETESESKAEIVISDFNDYKVVRRDGASETEIKAASEVYSAMHEKAPKMLISDDFYRENSMFKIIDTEILVGDTNREETQMFLSSLMPWQYGYGMVNDKIVICGYDEDETMKAAEAFINNVVSRDTLYYSSDDGYIFGSLKKGTGNEYSLVNITAENIDEAKKISASSSEYLPSVITVQTEDGSDIDFDIENYSLAISINGKAIYYKAEDMTYSSSGEYVLDYTNKEGMVYAVLRDNEIKLKYVFCSVYLSSSDYDSKKAVDVLGKFIDNCDGMPVIIAGKYYSAYNSISGSRLFESGMVEMSRYSGYYNPDCDYIGISNKYPRAAGTGFEKLDIDSSNPVYLCSYQRIK